MWLVLVLVMSWVQGSRRSGNRKRDRQEIRHKGVAGEKGEESSKRAIKRNHYYQLEVAIYIPSSQLSAFSLYDEYICLECMIQEECQLRCGSHKPKTVRELLSRGDQTLKPAFSHSIFRSRSMF
jgi:hypothetical protein